MKAIGSVNPRVCRTCAFFKRLLSKKLKALAPTLIPLTLVRTHPIFSLDSVVYYRADN